MIFDQLTLFNFGAFKGENTFKFSSNEKKPINLIGGLNGVGKTTILNSILILLFGKDAFDVSSRKYMLDIKSFFHRPKNEQLTITTTSISLQLRYIENKHEKSILIQRTWNHDSKTLRKSSMFKI